MLITQEQLKIEEFGVVITTIEFVVRRDPDNNQLIRVTIINNGDSHVSVYKSDKTDQEIQSFFEQFIQKLSEEIEEASFWKKIKLLFSLHKKIEPFFGEEVYE
jgi:hypothetical protein